MAKIIRFDPDNQLLLIDGERTQLSPKAFAVLDYLYQHKQQLVTKDDLLSAVWPKVYVTDAVLKVAVGEVRKALNDHPGQPEFIETVHRRGYRFIGELTMGNEAKSASLPATKSATFLVGREILLQQLDQFRQFALNGEKQLVFVRGEAGCGKSEALSAARRRHYHLRFAERLLAGYRGQLTQLVAQLAYHFESGGDLARALELRLLASEQAGQRFAYQEAIAHISKAIDLSQHDQDLSTHMAARKKHCHFLLASGRLPEAIAAYNNWIQASQQSGDVKHEVAATMGLSDVLFWVDRQACLDTAKQAVELSKQLADEKLHIYAQGKYVHFLSVIVGYQPEYAGDYEAALSLARDSGDPELQCVHYARYLYYLSIQSRYAETNELALETAQIARDSGDAMSYLSAEFFHAWGLFYRGEWAQMQTVMANALAEKNAHIPWVLHFRLQ